MAPVRLTSRSTESIFTAFTLKDGGETHGEKKRHSFYLFWLIVAAAGCANVERKGGEAGIPAAQPIQAAKAIPVISQSYASRQMAPGKKLESLPQGFGRRW